VPALDERARLPRQLLLEREVERLLVARDVEDVAHPSVVIIPTSAPVWVSAMFVATVVPCRRLSTCASDDPGLAAELADAFDRRRARVVGRRGDLVDRDPARLLVDEDRGR
jgi:hypothetical protein